MNSGLEDVVAAETVLSDVRGTEGQLIVRGYPLSALAGHRTFEEVVGLLFQGFFEGAADADELRARLGDAREEVFARTSGWFEALSALSPYDGMRAAIALLPDGSTLDDAMLLLAAPAVVLPALIRRREGRTPINPLAALSHADDVVNMLGREDGARALDTYFVTVADHGLNASTFAARVVASTQAGLVSSTLAGLGALKGPLHGGAPGPVAEMLDEISAEGDAEAWIGRKLAGGERLMGFGHRIYRTRDPRADALKEALRSLVRTDERLRFAEGVEQVALRKLREHKPDRVLETNVEFYTALLLEAVGFPRDTFTGVFAMGRVVGWTAHAREQASTGRLVRPASRYVGEDALRAA